MLLPACLCALDSATMEPVAAFKAAIVDSGADSTKCYEVLYQYQRDVLAMRYIPR